MDAGDAPEELLLVTEGRTDPAGQGLDEPDAGVVPRPLILAARVAESDDQLHEKLQAQGPRRR